MGIPLALRMASFLEKFGKFLASLEKTYFQKLAILASVHSVVRNDPYWPPQRLLSFRWCAR